MDFSNFSPSSGHINFLKDAREGEESQAWDTSWVAFDTRTCALTVYSDMSETEIVREIDMTPATFLYDLENKQKGGHLQIWWVID